MLQRAWYGVVHKFFQQSYPTGGQNPKHPGYPEFDQLVRQEEAAAMLRVGTRCMENWRHRGEGPKFVRVSGRCIRYRMSDLTQFIDERVRTSTSDPGKARP